MAGERVRVITADGQTGSVDAADVGEIVDAGGRVLTAADGAQARTDAAYAAQDTNDTALKVLSYAGPVPYAAHAAAQAAGLINPATVLPPEAEAYKQGVSSTFTGGLASLGEKEMVRAIAGDTAAKAYGKAADDVREAHAGLYAGGQLAGFLGTAVAGGSGAAAKAIPGVGITALGGMAERAAVGAVAKVAPGAAQSAIGRALTTGAGLGARGLVEGELYGAANAITEDMLGDREVVADKVFASMGTGGLFGMAGGGLLGAGGSLVASGTRATTGALGRALAKAEVGASKAVEAVEDEAIGVSGEVAARARAEARALEAQARGAVSKTAADVTDNARLIAGEVGIDTAKEAATVHDMLAKAGSKDAQLSFARRMAWDALGGGKGLQSTIHVKSAERFLPNGVETGGEYLFKHKLLDPDVGVLRTMWHGTPADMVPKLEQRVAIEGARVGTITKASPAMVPAAVVDDIVETTAKHWGQSAATKPLADRVRAFGVDLLASLGIAPKAVRDELAALKMPVWSEFVAARRAAGAAPPASVPSWLEFNKANMSRLMKEHGGHGPAMKAMGKEYAALKAGGGPVTMQTMSAEFQALKAETAAKIAARDAMASEVPVQDLIRERRALDDMIFDSPGAVINEKIAAKVKMQLRGQMEGAVEDALESASSKLPGEMRADYKAAKLDYSTAIKLLDLAKDSAARMQKAGVLGLTDTIYGGGSIPKALAHKVVRERGSAATAVLVHRMASMGTLTKVIGAFDDVAGRAARGLTQAPAKGALPERASSEPIRARAARVVERVAEAQANAEAHADRVVRQTEGLHTAAPQLASGVQQRMTSAIALLASKIPTQERDPWDLRHSSRMGDAQAAALVRTAGYVERPMRFFEEAAHGKITHEGAEVARVLMPAAYAELQQRVLEQLADMMVRGKTPPYQQRERLGIVLDVPSVASLRPEHMSFLQRNVVLSTGADKAPSPGAGAPPKRPISSTTQPSTLNRLEAGGRR